MNITTDKNLCDGCGICEALCPHIFKVGEDRKAEATIMADNLSLSLEWAKDVADSCPNQAIIIKE